MTSDFKTVSLVLGVCVILVSSNLVMISDSQEGKISYLIVALLGIAVSAYYAMPVVSKIAIAGLLAVSAYLVWLLID